MTKIIYFCLILAAVGCKDTDIKFAKGIKNVTGVSTQASVTFDNLEAVNSSNAKNYTASGSCSENGETVDISVSTIELSTVCENGSWSVVLDLSVYEEGQVQISATHSSADSTSQGSANVVLVKDTVLPEVSVDQLVKVTKENQKAYPLSGKCSEDGQPVLVTIQGLTKKVKCEEGVWKLEADVSEVADGEIVVVVAHNDTAQNPSTIKVATSKDTADFSIANLSSVELWLDAADAKTLYSTDDCKQSVEGEGKTVGCWLDKSGKEHHSRMNIEKYRPNLNKSLNQAAVEFDGKDDLLCDDHKYEAKQIFAVYRVDSSKQNPKHLGQIWGEYKVGHLALDARRPGTWSADGKPAMGKPRAKIGLSGGRYSKHWHTDPHTPLWSADQFEMVRSKFNRKVEVHQQIIGSLAPTFKIGQHQFGGQISELIVLNKNAKKETSQKIEGYLACKWNLQASLPKRHPYKSTCP